MIVCDKNTVTLSGGCLRTFNSSISLSSGHIGSNIVTPPYCGGSLALLDVNQQIFISGTGMTNNTVRYGGAICFDNIAQCPPLPPDTTPALVLINNQILDNNVENGGVIYYASRADHHATPMPDCLSSINSNFSSANTIRSLPTTMNPIQATYPYRLNTTLDIYLISNDEFKSAKPAVVMLDYFNQPVPLVTCQDYTICAKASGDVTLSPSVQTCGLLTSSFEFTTQNHVKSGLYNITFGGTAAVCTQAQENLLPEPDIDELVYFSSKRSFPTLLDQPF